MFFGTILSTFLWQLCSHWFVKILIFTCFFRVRLISHFLWRELSETFLCENVVAISYSFFNDFLDTFWDEVWLKKSIKIDKKNDKNRQVEGKHCQDEAQEAQESHQDGKKREQERHGTSWASIFWGPAPWPGGRGVQHKQPKNQRLRI